MPTDDANPWDDTDSADAGGDAPAEPVTVEKQPPAATEEPAEGPTSSAPEASAEADGDEPSPEDRRRVLVFAGIAFVVIAVIAFALTRGGDEEQRTGDGDTPTSQPGGSPPAGGSVIITGTPDTFNRADTTDGLGALPSGAQWVVQTGGWAIRANEAVVSRPEEQKRNTVFVATGYPDPQAQVRLTKIGSNAGMVFRYQGECNYWAVYAVPEFATWNVVKVIDCAVVGPEEDPDAQVYRTIESVPVADGTTVGVVLDGETIDIVLNGKVVTTIEDPDLAGVGRLGLTTKGPGEVRFDDFVAGGPEGQGVVGGTTVPADGATTVPGATTAPAEGATTAPAEGATTAPAEPTTAPG